MSVRNRFPILAALVLTLAVAACRDNKVSSYRVPKEKDPEPPTAAATTPADAGAAGNSMASTPVATSSGDGLTWTAPAAWKVKAASSMRKGSYSVTGEGGAEADFAITAFPGDVGGEAANINRWRGQVQLEPISNGEVDSALQRFERNGLKFAVVELVNKSAAPASQHMLAAQVPFSGSTWFFKLVGPDALVASQKAAFFAFLESVKPPSGPTGVERALPAPTVSAPPTPPAASAPAPSMANTAVPTASGHSLVWTAPSDWKVKAASAMRKGSYTVTGAAGEADFAITAFPGDVGGELANLNRWRNQVGLAPLLPADVEASITRVEQGGLKFVLVDFVNLGAAPASQHMLAALVPFDGSTWFFKLMGPDATVAAAKPAFLTFVKSVKAAP